MLWTSWSSLIFLSLCLYVSFPMYAAKAPAKKNEEAVMQKAYPWITTPPKGWECIEDPEQLPQKVKVIYVSNSSAQNRFTPSMNVASEETTLSLDEYTLSAKSYHEKQERTKCTQLGAVKTNEGKATLLQIDSPSQWGDIRFLQAILVHEGTAYVITATCRKQEFAQISAPILKAIQSFSLPVDRL